MNILPQIQNRSGKIDWFIQSIQTLVTGVHPYKISEDGQDLWYRIDITDYCDQDSEQEFKWNVTLNNKNIYQCNDLLTCLLFCEQDAISSQTWKPTCDLDKPGKIIK